MKDERLRLSTRFFGFIRRMMQSRVAEQLAIFLILTGLSLAICPWVGLKSDIFIIFAVSFASLLLVWLLTRRTWILPVLIGTLALGFGLLQLLKLSTDMVEFIAEFEFQAALFWRVSAKLHGILVILPLGFLLFIMVRRLLSLSVLGMLSAAVVIAQAVQHTEHALLVMVLLAVGYLILLPAVQFRRMRKTTQGLTISLSTLQLTAVPIAVLSVVVAVLLVPADTTKWKSETLLNMVYDCNDLFSYYFGRSEPRNDAFKLSGLGYYPLSDRLGGPISPGNRQLLTVHTNRPFLMRGAVEDTYSGKGWYDGWRNGRFRYSSLIWRFNRNQIFQPDLPLWKDSSCSELYESLITPVEATVSYNNGWTKGVFVAGRLNSLIPPSRLEVYYNNQSELFTAYTIGNDRHYSFTADVFNQSAEDFGRNMRQLEQKVSGKGDTQWQNICLQYLQLPKELPQSVTDTAKEITKGVESPYLKAAAIEQWLAQNCTYTLTPDVPPDGEDFVAHFLKTREGYCVYYASAMTVLARSAGLPARYITGFAMQKNPLSTEVYYVTEQTAHAWSEVYFEGIGWVTFDPLSFDEALEASEATAVPQQTIGMVPYQGMPSQQQTGEVGTTELNQSDIGYGNILFVLIILLLLCVVIYCLLRSFMRLPQRVYRYERLSRQIAGEGEQLDFCFKDILKQLEVFSLSLYTGETLQEFAPRCDRRLSLKSREGLAHTAQAYMRWQYGFIKPSKDEIIELTALHDNLEKRVLNKLGRVTYFFKRVLPVCREMLALRRKKQSNKL